MTVIYTTATEGLHINNTGEMKDIPRQHFEDAGVAQLPPELAMGPAPDYLRTATQHPGVSDTQTAQRTIVLKNPDNPPGDFVMSRWKHADAQPNKGRPSLKTSVGLGVMAMVTMAGVETYKDDYSWLSSHNLLTDFLVVGGLVGRIVWHIRAMRR